VGGSFEVGDRGRQLGVEAVGKPPVAEEGTARRRGDDEPWRHRQAEAVHCDEAVRLAAEHLRRFGDRRRERVDPGHRGMPSVASRSS
jgi:hypothetical protein